LLDVPSVDFNCASAVTGVCGACKSVGSGTASWMGNSGTDSLSGRLGTLMTLSRMKWERSASDVALLLEVRSGSRVSTTLIVSGFGWPNQSLALSHPESAATYMETEIGGL
jgi:hypothetical protein